jgi:hypothetical protein
MKVFDPMGDRKRAATLSSRSRHHSAAFKLITWTLAISVLAFITTLTCLFFGSTGLGVVIGAVVGYLVTLIFPQVIEVFRRQKVASGPFEWRLLWDAVAITVTIGLLTWLGVHVFQAYDIQDVNALRSVTLLKPFPAGISQMYDVEYDGKRYVAVGTYQPAGTGDTYLDAALWQSQDGGYSWNRMPHDDHLQGGIPLSNGKHAHRAMFAITQTDNGSLIFGNDNAPDGVPHGRVWRLRPGTDTVEAADDVQMPAAFSYTAYEKHGSEEVLAGFADNNAMVWHRDGNGEWLAEAFDASDISDVSTVQYENGRWILSGSVKSSDPDYSSSLSDDDNFYHNDAAIWTSNDAVHWQQVSGFAGVKGSQKTNDVVYIHGMWLAVGEDDAGDPHDMDPAIWVSNDSINWRRFDERTIKGAGWQTMTGAAVSPDKSNLIVVGLELATSDSEGPGPAPVNGASQWRSAAWQIDFAARRGSRSVLDVLRDLVK